MSASPIVYQFVDTNILVYAYDLSAGRKREIAKALMEQCWEDRNGCLSVQVLQEFYINVNQKIANPLDRPNARQIVADLAFWKVHTPEPQDVLEAIDLQKGYGLSFWDAMILQSAVQTRCMQLWSEDLSHGQNYGEVRVINPFFG